MSHPTLRSPVAYTAAVALALAGVTLAAPPVAAATTYSAEITHISGGDYTFGAVAVVGVQPGYDVINNNSASPTFTADDVTFVSVPAGVTAAAIEEMSDAVPMGLFYRLTAPPGDYAVRVVVRGQATDCVADMTFGAAAEPAAVLASRSATGEAMTVHESTLIGAAFYLYLAYFAADGTPVTGLTPDDIGFALDPSPSHTVSDTTEIAPGVYEFQAEVFVTDPVVARFDATVTLPGGTQAGTPIWAYWRDKSCSTLIRDLSRPGSRLAVGRVIDTEVYIVDDSCRGVGGLDKAYFSARTGVGFEVVSVQGGDDPVGKYAITFRVVARAVDANLLPLHVTSGDPYGFGGVTIDEGEGPVAVTLSPWIFSGADLKYGSAAFVTLRAYSPATAGLVHGVGSDGLTVMSEPAGVQATVIDEMWGFSTNEYVLLLTAPPGQYNIAVGAPGFGLGPAFQFEFGAADRSVARLFLDRYESTSAIAYGGTRYSTRVTFRVAYFNSDGTPVTGLTGDDIRFTFRPKTTGDAQGPDYSRGATTEIAPGVYEFPVDVVVHNTREYFEPTVTLPDGLTSYDMLFLNLDDLSCQSAVLKEPYGIPQEVGTQVGVWYDVYVVDGACQGVSGLDEADFAAKVGPGLEVIHTGEYPSTPGKYEVGVRATTAGEHTVFPDWDDTTLTATAPANPMDVLASMLRRIFDLLRSLVERLIGLGR